MRRTRNRTCTKAQDRLNLPSEQVPADKVSAPKNASDRKYGGYI